MALVTVPRYTVDDLDDFPDDGNRYERDAYCALGVREVWLVDVDDQAVEICRGNGAGKIVRDSIEWRMPAAELVVHVPLAEVFDGVS